MPLSDLDASWSGLAVALGLGLLIGVERERNKGLGPGRAAAGVRSFSIAALGGALAMWLTDVTSTPGLLVVATLVAGAFAVLAYRQGRGDDPGLTTELALFVTFLLGAVAMREALLAAGVGALLALLLASRRSLRRLATELITEAELRDGLMLAALALVAVPLLRRVPQAWLGVSPHALVRLWVILLALQAVGHIAQRWLGAQRGLWLTGLSSGLVSSTATIASLGARQKADPRVSFSAAAGGLASGVATWALAFGLVAAASPLHAWALAPACAAAALVTTLASLACLRADASRDADSDSAHRTGPMPTERGRVFQPGPAALVALLLALTTALATLAQREWGGTGLIVTGALAALADAHAAVGAAASLAAGGQIDTSTMQRLVLLAIGVNTASRSVVAWVAGGPAYAARIAAGLWAGWCAALLVTLLR